MATALITGASAGLGAEFARQLADRGHDLVLVARGRDRLEAMATELGAAHGIDVEVLPADLADRAQLQRVADRLSDGARPVDLLVNNAGFGQERGFLSGDVAEEELALDVMVRAVLVLSHAAGRSMRGRGHGAIVNVSSVAGFVVMGTYSALKSWVTVFSEALATELSGTGVTVTAVCPGYTHTEFHDRAKMDMSALPEMLWLQARDVVAQGLADAAAGKVVSVPSWQYRLVTGGVRVLPRRAVRGVSGMIARRRRTVDRSG
ncbi:SDR family NAD(P)-dependent oxidoreductase [Ornithinicoccus hortensis]|uniref:Short-subunit dehydrogenase n=1 Tax=Ornithinicoccus hortensis TaxID=82346 RepID=A0A542YW79_9MICO|nr:SDR family oxidoreductase [Ornithinicoccus hortensis]TQL52348.1 hypothetical protein FB467_3529 [Ornithinicoccus hortensis]